MEYKFRYWLLLLFFVGLQAQAQQKLGKKKGKVVTYYENGVKESEGRVKDHLRTGVWKYYDDEGYLDREIEYKEGEMNGTYVGYLHDGNPYTKGNYLYGKKSGKWITYYQGGAKASELNYLLGEYNGEQKWYYENGKLREQSNYSRNKMLTKWNWYRNGALKSAGSYENGLQSGRWVIYPDPETATDTFPSTIDEYDHGLQDGLHLKYVAGKKVEETHYRNGVLNGSAKNWDLQGRPLSIENYDNGHLQGHCQYWHNGILIREVTYEGRKEIGTTSEFDTLGRVTRRGWQNASGQKDSILFYYSNGKIKSREIYSTTSGSNNYWSSSYGRQDSKYYEYDSTGVPVLTGNYHMGSKQGVWTSYDPKGKKISEIEYDDDEIYGAYKLWYPNGKLKMQLEVVNNVVVEQPKAFDKSGVALKKGTKAYDDLVNASIPDEISNDPVNYRVAETNERIVFVPPVITDSEDPPMDIAVDEAYGSDEVVEITQDGYDENVSDIEEVNTYEKDKKKEEEIFSYVEQSPEYPGGYEALTAFIKKNLKYPSGEEEVTGTVYVRFVVEADGSLTHAEVLRGITGHPRFSDEAIRVVNHMPGWTPGKMNGRKVRTYVTQPIKFTGR